MNMRKIAVLGSLAAGAAMAFAPLASADPAAVDPTVVTDVLGGEESLLNGQFDTDALLTGVYSDVTQPTAADPFATITPGDVSTVQGTGTTPFDYAIYGVDPSNAGLAGDPGSYNVLNGAETEFLNAYNVELYSALNGGALDTNVADYIQNSSLDHALGLANTTDAADYLWNFGVGDLSAFFDTNLSFLDIGSAI
jgi:hypothetical protein